MISLKLDIKCLRNCWGVGQGNKGSFHFVYFLATSKSRHDVSGREQAWSCPGSSSQSWLCPHSFPEVLSGLELLVFFPDVGAGSWRAEHESVPIPVPSRRSAPPAPGLAGDAALRILCDSSRWWEVPKEKLRSGLVGWSGEERCSGQEVQLGRTGLI